MSFSCLVTRTVASTPLAALIAALALAIPAVPVLAQTPFGGDDMGTIPSDGPNGPITTCDNGVAKATANLAVGLVKCHIGRASGKFPDDPAENTCETTARTKFGSTKVARCLPCTSLTTVAADIEALIDGNNDKIFCTSVGTPFGGDDTGNIPPDAPSGPLTRCANRVAKAAANLVKRIVKCHIGRARGKFPTDAAEDGCEQTAISKFTMTDITGCDPCVALTALASFVETTVDGWNGLVYCPTTTTTTTTTLPSCSSCSPCNTGCSGSFSICADSSGTCGLQHLGIGVACVDFPGSCSGSCTSDSDCGSGETCDTFCFEGGCSNSCCSPCSCGNSPAPTCGGTCPGGEFCGQNSGGSSCECVCEKHSCPFATKWGSLGSGDGQFNSPIDVAVDGSGNVYVADGHNDRIEKFTNTGTFLTTWGSAGSGDGQFNGPIGPGGVTVRGTGSVFVADTGNNRIQKFDSNGTFLLTFGWGVADGAAAFETCTSSCQAGIAGSGNGQFNTTPDGLAVDVDGNVFAADGQNQRIQKFTNTGTFMTAWGSQGSGNGQFQFPNGVAVDGSGNVFVADSGNARIQKFDNNGTFLATWGNLGSDDGQFHLPQRVALDESGNVFVTDTASGGNSRIQEFTNTGTFIRTWGCPGGGDGMLYDPAGLTVDGSENVLVADTGNNRIQKFACP